MSKKRNKKCNPMSDLMNACPPENPYQFFCNAGLMAMGEEYGAVMNDLSEEVANIMLNAASTSHLNAAIMNTVYILSRNATLGAECKMLSRKTKPFGQLYSRKWHARMEQVFCKINATDR